MIHQVLANCSFPLVVVLVAQGSGGGVKDVPDLDSGAQAVDIDVHVKSQWAAVDVVAVDGGGANAGVGVLPDAVVAVDESVVKEEDGVSRRGPGVLHNSTNTVVAPGVGTTLGAFSHASEVTPGIALVNVGLVAVGGLGTIASTGETMELVALAGTNVKSKVGELLFPC